VGSHVSVMLAAALEIQRGLAISSLHCFFTCPSAFAGLGPALPLAEVQPSLPLSGFGARLPVGAGTWRGPAMAASSSSDSSSGLHGSWTVGSRIAEPGSGGSGSFAPTIGSNSQGLVPAGRTSLAALAKNLQQPLARLQANVSATRPEYLQIRAMSTCDDTQVAVCALVHADPRARALAMAWLKRPYRAVNHELNEAARYLLWWTNAMAPPLEVLQFEQHPSPPLLGTLALRILCTDSALLVKSVLGTAMLQGRELQQFILGVRSLQVRPPDVGLPFLPDPIDPNDILDALTAVLQTQEDLRREAIAWVKTPGTIDRPDHPWKFEVVTLLEGLPFHSGTSQIKQVPHLVAVVTRFMASGRQVILASLQVPAFGGQHRGPAGRPASGSQQAGEALPHLQTVVGFIEGVVRTAQAKHMLRTVLV
jgi:hypothetical protein